MAEGRNYRTRVDEIERRIRQLQEQRKDLMQRQKTEERKARNHRLIQLGAVVDQAFACEVIPEVLAFYLSTAVRRDGEGQKITVAEVQREYYLRAEKRFEEHQVSVSDGEA